MAWPGRVGCQGQHPQRKNEATRLRAQNFAPPSSRLLSSPTPSTRSQAPNMATSSSSLPRIGHCPAAGGGAPLRSLALVSLLLASTPALTAAASSSPSPRPHRELISKDAALSKAACFGSYPRYVRRMCCCLPKHASPGLSLSMAKRGQKARK